MTNLPINQRDKWSLLPIRGIGPKKLAGEAPVNEPKPNAFSAKSYEGKEEVVSEDGTKKLYRDGVFIGDIEPEDATATLNGYYTLVIFVTSGMIVGAILAVITMFALYGTAIERGKLFSETDNMIRQVQYNTDVIKTKVQQNADILPKINENIDKLGSGIVKELKPKEAKIVENN